MEPGLRCILLASRLDMNRTVDSKQLQLVSIPAANAVKAVFVRGRAGSGLRGASSGASLPVHGRTQWVTGACLGLRAGRVVRCVPVHGRTQCVAARLSSGLGACSASQCTAIQVQGWRVCSMSQGLGARYVLQHVPVRPGLGVRHAVRPCAWAHAVRSGTAGLRGGWIMQCVAVHDRT